MVCVLISTCMEGHDIAMNLFIHIFYGSNKFNTVFTLMLNYNTILIYICKSLYQALLDAFLETRLLCELIQI